MSIINTTRGRWGARALAALGFAVLPTLALQGTANAASCVAFSGSKDYNVENQHWTHWNGSLRSPGHNGESYNGGIDWRGKQYDRELWKGTAYRCNPAAIDCNYAWGQSKTVSTQWSVGLNIGGSLKGAAREFAAEVSPGYSRTTSYSESFTWQVRLYPGQYAQPYMASKMEPQSGLIRGAYKSPGSNGTQCTIYSNRGGRAVGYSADWDPTGVVERWTTNVRQWDFASYYIWR
ncbi:hypothetical protein [Streptomyces sp. GbtcB7]|uniref:hypothetical protein n=1 Tax=Streptomyces sp. GbtcB7 TaxID=2824752 RepID=UPI001C2F9599|nr:hypothetical protein [Streptomyces sp. GbtcB7]